MAQTKSQDLTKKGRKKQILLNFKDQVGKHKFKENTSNTSEFTECFDSNIPFQNQMKNWKHILDKHCSKAFPKIRIWATSLKPSKADKFINQRSSLLNDRQNCNPDLLNDLNVKIANTIATEERLKCHMMKKFCGQNGSVNVSEMWKMKKKIWPNKSSSLPTAKVNHRGQLVSSA